MFRVSINAACCLLACGVLAVACVAPGGPDGGADIDDRTAAFAWKAVGAGTYNSCAIAQDGQRYCWGVALVSDCAQAPCPINERPTPAVGSAIRFASVTSGGGIHCGVGETGDAYCWGDATYSGAGSLGDGETTASETPIRVAMTTRVRDIAAGYNHVCALDEHHDAYCWGSRLGGKLGRDVPTLDSHRPGKVSTAVKFRTISTGNTQTCAIALDDIAYCWGGGYGSLGAGARDTACNISPSCLSTSTPMPVEGGIRWAMISAGNAFTCGVSLDHRGYCWGAVMNFGDPNPPLGKLGNDTFSGSKVPVAVSGDLQFQSITTGTRQACGLTLTGEAYCWGNNGLAELGIGTTGGRFASPQRVVGGLRFVSLSLADHTCGLTVNHNVYCWGLSYGGRLGNGQSVPASVSRPTRVLQPSG